MKWGDVVLVRFPHPSGQRGKKRPAVVVQSDAEWDWDCRNHSPCRTCISLRLTMKLRQNE